MKTRAQEILPRGMTAKKLAGQTRKNIAHVKGQLERLALPWVDVDNTVCDTVQRVLFFMGELELNVDQAEKLLQEPMQ